MKSPVKDAEHHQYGSEASRLLGSLRDNPQHWQLFLFVVWLNAFYMASTKHPIKRVT